MATLHNSSFDLEANDRLSNSTRIPSRGKSGTGPFRAALEVVRSQKPHRHPLADLKAWEIVEERGNRKPFEKRVKRVAEQLRQSVRSLQGSPASGTVPGTDAAVLLHQVRFLRAALLEAQAALSGEDELPYVETQDTHSPVPRVYAVSECYLRAAGYSFDKADFVEGMAEAQKKTPLEMSEVWNLKGALEFVLLERIAEASTAFLQERSFEPNLASGALSDQLSCCVRTLRHVLELDWKACFDQIDETERILRTDPEGSFCQMDSGSREQYRSAVGEMAKHSNCSEHEIARKAILLAQEAQKASRPASRTATRKAHVGYYLIGAGQETLKREIGYKARVAERIRDRVLKSPDYFYLIGIEAVALLAVLVSMALLDTRSAGILALALLLLPAIECAVGVVNWVVTSFISPKRLPRLDFSKGIPPPCATLVAVPILLTSESQVRAAVRNLEIRFLGNRDTHLHFALLTDPPDSNQPFDDKDELASLCSRLIEELNQQYAGENRGTFFHFHRHRTFNESEGAWMGWERKRGKILELNRLLLKQEDPFPVKTGDLSLLSGLRYVITLDLDTQLPSGSAHRLIGTIAHPLNAAVINPLDNTVVEGYGILQPRLQISQASANRSRLAALFSGDTAFDIYTRAVSDVYQDLFGEAIFSGKGIYEIGAFQRVLDRRFPPNSILSHDLIEGAYARAGFVGEVDLIDDYPPDFSSLSRRKHRWIRGDWQIAPWLFGRVRDSVGRWVRNPTSHVSRWKIIDNLRRSMADIAILAALLFGWFCLPVGAAQWTLAILGITFAPTSLRLLGPLMRAGRACLKWQFWKNILQDWVRGEALVACRLAFLLHQSLVSLDAILRTLVRVNFSHKHLLEWEAAADAESAVRRSHVIDGYLHLSSLLSLALGIAICFLHPSSLPAALPFLLTWFLLPGISRWLDGQKKTGKADLSAGDEVMLRNLALRTWRFFREFSTAEENWLIPDIVRETPRLIAHRISPTNLGLLLNVRLAAHDLGFITLNEFVWDTEKTLQTVKRMPTYKGHPYNWYTTDTLEPVEPRFVSTVDNANLVCSLWTLKEGCRQVLEQPLFRPAFWQGVLDHIELVEELVLCQSESQDLRFAIRSLRQRAVTLAGANLSRFESFLTFEEDVAIFLGFLWSCPVSNEIRWWSQELANRMKQLVRMLEDFAPWLLPAYAETLNIPVVAATCRVEDLNLSSAPHVYARVTHEILRVLHSRGHSEETRTQLNLLAAALLRSQTVSQDLARRLRDLSQAAQSWAHEMDFSFLYDPERRLLSIGYEAGKGAISKWHYDLLPSEARAATFVAIAQGAIPQRTWFDLGRFYGKYKGVSALLSWTGTMFEYLMPFLWMKPFPNTTLERGAYAAIVAQRKFAKEKNIPWGMSECACNEQSADGHYSYRAFGMSALAIHRDEFSNDIVIAPYATFLALLIDRTESMKNLRRMKNLGWLREFGFYEAADFTPGRVRKGREYELVRSWMAHHQGMSLLAAANLLCDSAMQRRFHANSIVAAAERVLYERLPRLGPEVDEEYAGEVKPSPSDWGSKDWLNKSSWPPDWAARPIGNG
jgi:cyclic beta-1,2-glucan synthetase